MMDTDCFSEIEFPDVSVAVHVTMVSPSGKNSGASLEMEAISTVSFAIRFSNVTIFSYFDVASKIIFSDI